MPTDADWGRLYNFNTTGDAGLIMPPRSYYSRDFFAGDWTDMAWGLIYAVNGDANDLAIPTDERLSETSIVNLPHFGLVRTGMTIDNVSNPDTFVGLRGVLNGTTQLTASPLQLSQLEFTCVRLGVTKIDNTNRPIPLTNGTTSGPFAMLCMRFGFNPTAQTMTIKYSVNSTVTLASDAENVSKLQTAMNALASASPSVTFAGITSVKEFSTYYLYWPYFNNRLKLHCVGTMKLG